MFILMPASKKQPTGSIRFYLYEGLFGGHNTYALKDEEGKTAHFSYNSITHKDIKALEKDPDYKPSNESYFEESDLPYLLHRFWTRQIAPMKESQAMVVRDPKELSDTLPPFVEIPLSKEEFIEAEKCARNTEVAVKRNKKAYSIWARRSGERQLESCASVSQNMLERIAKPNEKSVVELSFLEKKTTPLPTRVHERARMLGNLRKDNVAQTTLFSSSEKKIDEEKKTGIDFFSGSLKGKRELSAPRLNLSTSLNPFI